MAAESGLQHGKAVLREIPKQNTVALLSKIAQEWVKAVYSRNNKYLILLNNLKTSDKLTSRNDKIMNNTTVEQPQQGETIIEIWAIKVEHWTNS